ncbi:MAG: hypothetical protein P8Y10_15300 [Gemmatimonadales bacterium]|jgi:CO dehydrogenase nickel-insertion accessory protein CooC1
MNYGREPLVGLRIGFVGKGGSGKSTALVLIAEALRRRKHEVCVLDADSTNVGVHRALGLATAPRPLLDYFGGMVFSGGLVTCPVDDPTPLAGANLDLARLTPDYCQRTNEGIHVLSAGKLSDMGPGAGCDGPISKITRDVRFHIGEETPVTLIDFKAGFEDSARGAVNSVDWILVVVDPSNAAIRLAFDMKRIVELTRAGVPPATDHLDSPNLVSLARRLYRQARISDVFVVLNRVRDDEIEAYLVDRLSEGGIEPIGAIPEDPALTTAWLKGDSLADYRHEVGDEIVLAMEDLAWEPLAVY